MKWTQEEKDALLGHVWASDEETLDERIEHAHYKMYEEDDFSERSLIALKSMYFKLIKKLKQTQTK